MISASPQGLSDERRARYALALWALFGLFILRVLAQALIAVGYGGFLPPWEEWFSGLVPYPQLLVSQLVIVAAYGKVCLDLTRGRGFFARPRRWLGALLLWGGSLYFSVMVIRYAIRMSLYPPERWTGGSIPIFFHWVLAGFILVLAAYHRRFAGDGARRTTRSRFIRAATFLVIVAGVLAWMAYQLAPTILAALLHARRAEHAVRIDRGVPIAMSDGVTLKADIYRPLRVARAPTILVRIPFSKTVANSLFATIVGRFWAERGYTSVIQGTRGRYESGGRHTPLVDERRDGLDTLDWLERQPSFDGRLGMWGGSAFGYTQWAIADRLPPPPDGKSALLIQIASTDFHGMFYPGGAFSLASALFWAVRSRGVEDEWPDAAALGRGVDGAPLVEADDRAAGDVPFFDDWVRHQARDAYWQAIDGDDRAATLRSPVLLMAGWFDPFLPGQLDDFARVRRDAPPDVARASRLVVGPWAHAESVQLPGGFLGRNYRLESLEPSVPWFDRHLLGRGDGSDAAPVRIFVMGANVWRDEQEWPLARARETSWYLHSGGHAGSASGDGRLSTDAGGGAEPADTFTADPAKPVPTRGGAMIGGPSGSVSQSDVESRADVLVYTSPPLAEDLEVTGPVSVTLHVTTTAPSTDFTAKLVDVHENGMAYNVSDGILRNTYTQEGRGPDAVPRPIVIALWPTSMVFRKGHRIRLDVAGSNFPRFDRNPNTGEPTPTAVETAIATNMVHHGGRAPSRLVLPIVGSQR